MKKVLEFLTNLDLVIDIIEGMSFGIIGIFFIISILIGFGCWIMDERYLEK